MSKMTTVSSLRSALARTWRRMSSRDWASSSAVRSWKRPVGVADRMNCWTTWSYRKTLSDGERTSQQASVSDREIRKGRSVLVLVSEVLPEMACNKA